MDRVELEALVVRLVDQVQFRGYAVRHDVEEPALLRELVRKEAEERSLRILTGTATGDERTVWACRPEDDMKFLHPKRADNDERAAIEAMERAIRQHEDPPASS